MTCVDEDECTAEGVCSKGEKCHNTVGSFRCSCKEGYRQATDTEKCLGLFAIKVSFSD